MTPPKLHQAEVESLALQVAIYIEGQRETFRQRAMGLNANQLAAMQPFFPASTLDPARLLVLTHERVVAAFG